MADVCLEPVIGLGGGLMGFLTGWSVWGCSNTHARGRFHVRGRGRGAVRGCRGCQPKGNESVSLGETSVYPPDCAILAAVDCVAAMVGETTVCPPDSWSPVAGENVLPPQTCARGIYGGCPC